MKAHFGLRRQLRPILTSNRPIRQEGCLYTQCGGSVVVTDVETLRIVREIPVSGLGCFDLRGSQLVVCSTGVAVHDLCSGKTSEMIQVLKTEICVVSIDASRESLFVVVGRVDGSVSGIYVAEGRVVWTYRMENRIVHLGVFGNTVCSTDGTDLWMWRDGEIEKHSQPGVVGIVFNEGVHTLTVDGELVRWSRRPRTVSLGVRCSAVMGDEKMLYVGSGRNVCVYDYEGRLLHARDILGKRDAQECEMSPEDESEMSREASMNETEDGDDESGSERREGDMREGGEETAELEDEVVIESISRDVISTTEQEIFLVDGGLNVERVVVGNNDEITDMKQWNDVLFVATNSGRLRYTVIHEGEGEYAFEGVVVPAHDEAIMSLSICGDLLMTASRDRRCVLWRICREEQGVAVKRIRTVDNALDGQNGCVLGASVFAMAGADILQIWDYRENVFMEKIHRKEINSVEICEARRLIATASQDKTAKILDFEGRTLHVLAGHTKGVWSTCFGKNLAATCSADNTVRLWTMDTFACVGSLAGHRSAVLRAQFYRNDDLLITGCVTGEMKVWNVRKRVCEMNIDVHRDRVWAFIAGPQLITSGNGCIAFLEDDSAERAAEELRAENERATQQIELEGCLRSNLHAKAVEILAKMKDHQSLFRTLVKCYRERPVEVFDVFESRQRMFFEILLKQGTFKNGAVVHWLLQEALKRRWRCGRDVMDKIHHVVGKHSECVDEIYADLLGFTIFD